jgi:hypothetical protein
LMEDSADAQHSGPDQQQQQQQQQHTPSYWLLEGIHDALQACTTLLGSLRAMLVPLSAEHISAHARMQVNAAAVGFASQLCSWGGAVCCCALQRLLQQPPLQQLTWGQRKLCTSEGQGLCVRRVPGPDGWKAIGCALSWSEAAAR